MWWWWAWGAFVLFIVLLPLAFGWGYRGWGPPYPTYYRRRYPGRGVPIAPESRDVSPDEASVPPMGTRTTTMVRTRHQAPRTGDGWSFFADLFWLGLLAAIGWGVYLWVT